MSPLATGELVELAFEEAFKPQARTLRQLFGLSPVPLRFAAPTLGATASYHTEVPAPEELVISRAELVHVDSAGNRRILDQRSRTFRAHLRAADMARSSFGLVDIHLRLRRSGLVVAALVLSLFTAAILGAGWYTDYNDHGARLDIGTALLVALPGLYALYLVRPGEHRLLKHLVTGLRFLIGMLALLSFAAAASLTIDINETLRISLWGFGALAASCVALVVATGSMRSWWTER